MAKKLTIGDMQYLAKKRMGKCLSKKYVNSDSNLKWLCKQGHVWMATPSGVKNGTWCRVCAFKIIADKLRTPIEDIRKIARIKQGKCLSKKYIGTYLKWQCKEGHIWEATLGNIKSGKWCPYCAGKYQTIKDMIILAKKKGGECLSKRYKGIHTNLKWRCKQGHVWKAMPSNIKKGRWCPVCSSLISERICRKYFELIFNTKFPKSRPNWLRNSRGNKMELDGYCKELGIAFEFQGEQHYRQITFFHRKRNLKVIQIDDRRKRRLCGLNNISLIEVPYTVSFNNFGQYILQQCKNQNIKLPKIIPKYNYQSFDIYSPEKLNEMQMLAKTKKGKCLSKKYVQVLLKLRWRCKEGHIWGATPHDIKRGTWCPQCANNFPLTLNEMRELAKKRGGKSLSKNYLNSVTKFKWQCKEGHIWRAMPGSIKRGTWCPYCAGRYATIRNMRLVAEERNGKCLSKRYVNSNSKLKWLCKQGHVWMATPNSIKNGRWCRKCSTIINAEKQRHTLKEMQQLAIKKDGKCLSKVYVSALSKLNWQCDKGHIWKATPGHVKFSTWCPYCANVVKYSLNDIQQLAKVKSGNLISKRYFGAHNKLKWQCKNKHIWETTANSIRRGTWCPRCEKIRRKHKTA